MGVLSIVKQGVILIGCQWPYLSVSGVVLCLFTVCSTVCSYSSILLFECIIMFIKVYIKYNGIQSDTENQTCMQKYTTTYCNMWIWSIKRIYISWYMNTWICTSDSSYGGRWGMGGVYGVIYAQWQRGVFLV